MNTKELSDTLQTCVYLLQEAVKALNDHAHVMTIDEVRSLKPGDSAWLEWILVHEDGTQSSGIEQWVVTPDFSFHCETGCIYLCRVKLHNDNQTMERYWSAEPTEEERRSVPW